MNNTAKVIYFRTRAHFNFEKHARFSLDNLIRINRALFII